MTQNCRRQKPDIRIQNWCQKFSNGAIGSNISGKQRMKCLMKQTRSRLQLWMAFRSHPRAAVTTSGMSWLSPTTKVACPRYLRSTKRTKFNQFEDEAKRTPKKTSWSNRRLQPISPRQRRRLPRVCDLPRKNCRSYLRCHSCRSWRTMKSDKTQI